MSFEISEAASSLNIFQINFSKIGGKRIDPFANQPRRYRIEKDINDTTFDVRPLGHLVEWVKNTTHEISSDVLYVGLENIDGETGFCLPSSERDTISSGFKFSSGHILFPKLRPYLNKTHLATFSGVDSTTKCNVIPISNVNSSLSQEDFSWRFKSEHFPGCVEHFFNGYIDLLLA